MKYRPVRHKMELPWEGAAMEVGCATVFLTILVFKVLEGIFKEFE